MKRHVTFVFRVGEFSLTELIILLGTGFGIPNWDFLGSVMVTGSYVRLTPNEQSKQGALWNKLVSSDTYKYLKSYLKDLFQFF